MGGSKRYQQHNKCVIRQRIEVNKKSEPYLFCLTMFIVNSQFCYNSSCIPLKIKQLL